MDKIMDGCRATLRVLKWLIVIISTGVGLFMCLCCFAAVVACLSMMCRDVS